MFLYRLEWNNGLIRLIELSCMPHCGICMRYNYSSQKGGSRINYLKEQPNCNIADMFCTMQSPFASLITGLWRF